MLVLALGIALGAGPLQHSGQERDRPPPPQKRKLAQAKAEITDLTAAGKYASDFAGATSSALVSGKLVGRTVALVLLPEADQDTVEALRSVLTVAGARVTSEAIMAPVLGSAESRQLVEALTSQMVAQNPSLEVPADAAGYERLGALLARGIAADRRSGPGGSSYDQTAVGIVSGLQAADLVTVLKSSPRASLSIVVAGPPASTDAEAAANAVPVTIVKGYAAETPTVLVGPTGAAGPRGVLGLLRTDKAASADIAGVDSADTPMGRVAVVLALVARIQGLVGQYGGVGATDGPVPSS